VTIIYPGWYQGGFPDVETLLKALFTPLLSGVDVISWLPPAETIAATINGGDGYLRVYRLGGHIDHEENRDEPNVQFAALTGSRNDSNELIEFVRQVLDAFSGGNGRGAIVPGTGVLLGCEREIVGPQTIPEQYRDEKLVPATFTLHTWKPKGLPNYRQALGL
jgi:hypothetical protein